ncbi:MAG: Flp pilus assembly complex ATPase component TadA [Levilactobacillus sp.]|jgi:competence protein ComGA|uniref:competence type IV pilus ATPase ComGA n=1 Tax=Levilactobacillus sp. TaxID=2767919 RepID=UPI00258F22D3|nr:competence type IV pilus ATPase ComGA [Levilactobacillus sp.]MCH4124378.1 Flp pilus assembly complex ATPase component TadA [Levilactobacillus sp.]MCI1554572.1 Flp pilus assembly complex ATPase component TadA [Levilactobacillus sp.]MCI1606441.1 Flp pilus assembly complex ATPase component TadA [Levilactobacillus sp.]
MQTLIDELLAAAVGQTASDIYILPQADSYQIRLRHATGLVAWQTLPADRGRQVISYFKFHANMTVSENRRPQVGAMTWPGPPPIELRFSTVGDFANRESLVIRLIYPYALTTNAYLVPNQQAQLQALASHRGLVLLAGPTGAGKTTTLYHVASQLNASAVVLTVEDPVEIKEPRFMQLQVNPAAGMTYEALIKVGLRHRPDVFIIGEIRDAATAQAAIRAALSGHLVLSTVHAQHAAGAISRLQDLGIATSQLRQVLTASCYQRLLPRVAAGPAVLLDMLHGTDLWTTTSMTEGWQKHLDEAVRTNQISLATAQRFQFG